MLSRFFGEAAELLEEEFEHIYNMTDNQFHQVKIDTRNFREAIWFYVQRLFGVNHDDFAYENVC